MGHFYLSLEKRSVAGRPGPSDDCGRRGHGPERVPESGRGTRPSEVLAIRPFGREISRRGPIAALKTENLSKFE